MKCFHANNTGIFSYPVKAESCARCCLSVVPSFFQMWTKHSRPGQRGDLLDVIKLWCWSGSICFFLYCKVMILPYMSIVKKKIPLFYFSCTSSSSFLTFLNSFSFLLSAQNLPYAQVFPTIDSMMMMMIMMMMMMMMIDFWYLIPGFNICIIIDINFC